MYLKILVFFFWSWFWFISIFWLKCLKFDFYCRILFFFNSKFLPFHLDISFSISKFRPYFKCQHCISKFWFVLVTVLIWLSQNLTRVSQITLFISEFNFLTQLFVSFLQILIFLVHSFAWIFSIFWLKYLNSTSYLGIWTCSLRILFFSISIFCLFISISYFLCQNVDFISKCQNFDFFFKVIILIYLNIFDWIVSNFTFIMKFYFMSKFYIFISIFHLSSRKI